MTEGQEEVALCMELGSVVERQGGMHGGKLDSVCPCMWLPEVHPL